MSKTKIEWADHTVNPVKGLCPMACSYCYARRMYLNPYYRNMYEHQALEFNPFWASELPKKPSKIFVGSTMELFHEDIKDSWRKQIFEQIEVPCFRNHTYIFLTKKPENLIKWSPFPDNCWVGVSVTNAETFYDAILGLNVINAKIKFISFEPLLEQINGGECEGKRLDVLNSGIINWLIIGQQTPSSRKTQPQVNWIREIVEAADQVGIPVFLKNNLETLIPFHEWDDWNPVGALRTRSGKLRQEFPTELVW